jgi:two-component system, chemotaxis family, CheB/CheR fusion protein
MYAAFPIVSLCGSSGALPAYVEILRAMPADSGMSFVVLTHRREQLPSHLVDVLSRETRMPVEEVREGTVLQPNHVYVIPGGKDMTIGGTASRFHLAPAATPDGWPGTFDIYLESLAGTTYGRAITVILSGLAKDGSAALKHLRQRGGVNYAQTDAPESSMPESAMLTGMVDYAGSPAQIAQAILGWAAGPKKADRRRPVEV